MLSKIYESNMMNIITKVVLLAIKMIWQYNWFTSFGFDQDVFNLSMSNFKVLAGIVWELGIALDLIL